MSRTFLWLGIAFTLTATLALAQNRLEFAPTISIAAVYPEPGDDALLAGNWTYRSYVNTTDIVGNDPAKALGLIFGEGTFIFEKPASTGMKGVLDMGGGYVLDLQATLRSGASDASPVLEIVGLGRDGTPTAGWQYDYNASLAHHWPNGVDQIPALVGSVIRVKPHGSAPAGYVASFVAVKHP